MVVMYYLFVMKVIRHKIYEQYLFKLRTINLNNTRYENFVKMGNINKTAYQVLACIIYFKAVQTNKTHKTFFFSIKIKQYII